MVVPPANGPSGIVTSSSVAWLRLRPDLNPMNSGASAGTGLAAGDAADVLALGGQPGADEPGPGLPPPQRAGDVERPACVRGSGMGAPRVRAASTAASRASSSEAKCRHRW